MLKKSLLLMLFVALLAPWTAKAQGTLTVCEGMTQNQYIPFYAYSGDTEGCNSEFIIPASELTALNGKTITAITFSVAQQQSKTWTAIYNVYLAEVSSTTLTTTLGPSAGTIVYTGTVDASSSEMTITFDNDYTYNGGNLLVGTYVQTAGAWDSSGKFYGIEAEGAAYITGTWGGGDDGGVDFIPQTTFTYLTDDPWISLNTSSMIVITGSTQDLTASYGNVTGTPTIAYSSSNAKIASVSGSGTSATVTGNSVGTATITATMTYNATEYTATCAVTVEEPSYCTPSFSSPGGDYIANFVTTGGDTNISNSTGASTGGYGDYYDSQSVSIEAGNTLTCTVTPSTTAYSYGHSIWVDWNRNYEFENDERVAYSTSIAVGDWTGEFEVPSTTAAGDYRLRVIHLYNNNVTNPCHSATYGEGEDYKLTVTAANPYQKPVNLQVSNLTAATATITWEAPNSDVQSYKYQYQPEGGTWTDLTTTTTLSAPLTSLTGNTTYNFQVQAIYAGNNESTFATTSFTTECNSYPVPYPYGFETAGDMDCWETVDCEVDGTNGLNGYLYNSTNNPYARGEAGGCFGFSSYNGNTEPQYLISPQLSGIAAGLHVEFYYRSIQDNDEETFEVGYSITDKNITSFTWGTEVLSSGPDYNRFSANYPANVKYVAVKYTSADSYYLFIDDFTFEEAASCLEPTAVTASNITTNSADITWTNGGEETTWDIYATDDINDVPGDLTTPTVEGVTTKPYQLTLLPGTTYYVYVRAACSAKEHSVWSSPHSFHTDCEGMDLPYGPYGFEDGALTVCWNHYSDNLAYNSASVYNNSTYAHTGDKSLRFYRGSTAGDLVLALPVVDDSYDLSDYQFEFYAYAIGTNMMMTIGIMDDPNDLTTFVAQGTEFNPATSYTEYKVRFDGYTGTGKYVAIKVTRSGGSSGSIFMDDIAINPIPSCIEPTGLAVTAPTPHGATFSWTAGGSETEWHLYFGKNATAPADDINLKEVTVADSNPFTLTTGLDAETDYYVWVRANCGGTDGYSMWVGPETFTTEPACFVPTGLTASEVTSHTAKLSWTGTSDSYNVWYRTAATMSNPIFSETFETSSLPTGWGRSSTALTDDVLNGTTTINSYNGGWFNTSSGLGQYNWKMNIYSTGKFWLITPSITLDAKNTLNFDAAITAYNSNNAPTSSNMADGNSRFVVLITTDNQATWTILREWNNTGSADVLNNISNTGNNFSIDLTAYAGETVKIAFYGGQTSSGPDCDLHIDNVVIGTPVEAGEWTKKTADASPYVATGLLVETKYEAMVQGNCGSEGTSQWTSSVFFTTDIACPAPSALTPSNPTSVSFDLSWNNGGASDWIVAYKKTTETDFTEISLNISDVTEEAGVISYTLGGLDDDTEYTVKVRDNCEPSYTGDGVSDWTAEVTYSTIPACSALNPVVSDITHHNATVNFEGESATGFNVYYRTAAGINASFSETFDAATLPTGWDKSNTPLTDDVLAGTTTIATGYQYGWSSTSYGLGQYNWKMNIYSTNKYWLITPSVTIGTNNILNFDAAITKYNGDIAPTTTNMADANSRFVVLITTDDMATWTILREWNNTGSADVLNNISNIGNNFTIDLSSYKDETVKIAFYGHQGSSGPDCDLHIDNVMVGEATTQGAWETEAATSTTANLTGLTAGTKYDVKVVPNCDNTIESNTVQFTTLPDNVKYFLTAGDWGNATNWMDNDMPNLSDNVQLQANATIASTDVAQADKITLNGKTLTINDGGQLKTNNTVTATVKKHITGYTGIDDHYYLIANPLNSMVSKYDFATVGLTSGEYDLYSWSYSATDGLEWRNFEASQFSLQTKTGYLYANESDVDLTFTGTVAANNAEESIDLNYATSSTYYFNGWNLVGNPFVCDAFITDTTNTDTSSKNLAFYRMNADGDGFTAVVKGTIKPMEGIFVKANAQGQNFKFTREEPVESPGSGNLNINLAQTVTSRGARGSRDNAIVRFDGGNSLDKFSFRDNTAKVYIPRDGKDYAVVSADAQGELPVNFKAAENGNYTLSFTTEDVEFSYLHLIDNMTGNDVDLLQTPSYNFDAQYTDIAARFKLVFAKSNGNMGDDFGFIDANGNLIINGEGTLRVIDALGRIIMTRETTFGVTTENMVPGVYVLQLINGNDVKTQKIVVK